MTQLHGLGSCVLTKDWKPCSLYSLHLFYGRNMLSQAGKECAASMLRRISREMQFEAELKVLAGGWRRVC